MTRRPFNNTCDIYSGPTGTPPNTFLGTFDCRLVFQDGIETTLLAGPEPLLPYWLTIEDAVPQGMFVAPGLSLDTGRGDRIAVPTGTAVRFAVLYTDLIIWKDQLPYFRAYLVRYPLPSYLSGGVLVGGSAVIVPPGPATEGGVHCGGEGDVIHGGVSGGVLVGGLALVKPGQSWIGLGGALVGGLALVKPGQSWIGLGGALVGGLALVKPGQSWIGLGGVLVGGVAKWSPPTPALPTGGVLVGGAAVTVSHLTLVYDSYSSASGTNPTTRAPDIGPAPTSSSSAYQCQSGKLTTTSAFGFYDNSLVYDAGHADVTASVDVTAVNLEGAPGTFYDGGDLIMRYVDDSNFYVLQPYQGNLRILKFVGGAISVPASAAATVVNGVTYRLKCVMTGNVFDCYIDGVFKFTYTDSFQNTATKHGVILNANSNPAGCHSTADELLITT